MRILFICGSLDPGRDGVGDYTRELARTCVEFGHSCLLISLCDVIDEDSETGELKQIRRRAILNESVEQQTELHRIITEWKPDWYSLQFVCFAFHPKGFVHTLFAFIDELPTSAQRHLMFHELWIQQAPLMPFKLRILGFLQGIQIRRAIKRWDPQLTHTSNSLYRTILSNHHIPSKELPLFGNIPIAPPDSSSALALLSEATPQQRIVIVPFSQLDRWEVLKAMTRLHQLAEAASLTLHLVQVGVDRNGEARWNQIQQLCEQWGWKCDQLGPQDSTTVSQLMQIADLGMNSAHIQICQKSGAVLSILEHGLPVLCAGITPESQSVTERPTHTGIFSINDSDATLIKLLKSPEKRTPQSSIIAVAQQFIADLASH